VWAEYEPAVRRWEGVLGWPAPPPAEPGPSGRPRLSAEFAEWMMGLAPGFVTGVPGIPRTRQLKIIGNGVVPQQAALALRLLIAAAVPVPFADRTRAAA
jgi:DNA (cytosine-5)-methyltransferase 1